MFIDAKNICRDYRTGWLRRRRHPVLEDVNLRLAPGTRVGIVGRSGSGKTTLGLMLAGIQRPDRGHVCIDNVDLWSARPGVRRRLGQQLQLVFQHPESTFDPRWTMARSLGEPFVLKNIPPAPSHLAEMLEAVELDPALLHRYPAQLSGGELQRMAIARALAMQPLLLVLDEPTAMLDALTQAHIIRLLDRIQKKKKIRMVLISHDMALVDRFCDKTYRLHSGRLDAV